jgi:hypothetical protein
MFGFGPGYFIHLVWFKMIVFSNVKIFSTTGCKTLNNYWKRDVLWCIFLFSGKQKNPSCRWKLRPEGLGCFPAQQIVSLLQ